MIFSSEQYLIFWAIRIIVLASFFITGLWISRERRPRGVYWVGVFPLLIIYSLAEGLRWNREEDYYNYYNDIVGTSLFHEDSEWLYSVWIDFFKNTGLPFWAGFLFYSFILLFAFLCLVRRFPKTAKLALPLFFIITSVQSENLVRQFFSLSFIIFSLVAYFDKRYLLMIICLFFAENIHFSAVVPIAFFLFSVIMAFKYKPQRPIIPIIIYVFLYLFWDVSFFSVLVEPILNIIPETGTNADSYLQSVSWFTADGSLALLVGKEYAGRSVLMSIVQFPTYLFIIYYGYNATKDNDKLRICYWCAFLAILLDITRGDIQNYLRLFHWIAFILSIIIGTIYSELRLNRNVKIMSVFFLSVYYLWTQMFSNLLVQSPWGYAFIWDR